MFKKGFIEMLINNSIIDTDDKKMYIRDLCYIVSKYKNNIYIKWFLDNENRLMYLFCKCLSDNVRKNWFNGIYTAHFKSNLTELKYPPHGRMSNFSTTIEDLCAMSEIHYLTMLNCFIGVVMELQGSMYCMFDDEQRKKAEIWERTKNLFTYTYIPHTQF